MATIARLLGRTTGISTPFGGISWEPDEDDREIVRRLLIFIEDRRVLYNPMTSEDPIQAEASVRQIRERLTEALQAVGEQSAAMQHLSALRGACRSFLDDRGEGIALDGSLEPFRGDFADSIAGLASEYGIETDLADQIRASMYGGLGPPVGEPFYVPAPDKDPPR